MMRAIAYRLQEIAHGGASKVTQRRLMTLACRCSGPNNGAPSDCRRRLRFEPNSADPSRSFPRAANPPCRHRKALSLCFGLSISWSGKRNFVGRDWRAISGAECGRTAGIRFADREYASLTDRNCEGFCRPGNRVGLPGLHGGGCRDRTDGHRSLASLQNEAARRGFSARNDLSQRMSKSLAGKLKALTMNCYLPVSLRFHSLSSRSRAMVVTCSRALRRLQE